MSMPITRRGCVLLAAVGALLLAAFAAAPPAEAATIYGCVKKKGGTIHIVAKKAKCKKGESKLSWSTEGPAGKNGTAGAPGTAGSKGEAGAKGETGAAATTLWAVVEFNGTFVRGGTGAVSSISLFTGGYEVVFKRDVTKCAYVATLGSTTDGSAPTGEIGVASREGNADGVYLETFNSGGTLTAEPFHLAVFC